MMLSSANCPPFGTSHTESGVVEAGAAAATLDLLQSPDTSKGSGARQARRRLIEEEDPLTEEEDPLTPRPS